MTEKKKAVEGKQTVEETSEFRNASNANEESTLQPESTEEKRHWDENKVDEQKEKEPVKKRRGRPKKSDNSEPAARKTNTDEKKSRNPQIASCQQEAMVSQASLSSTAELSAIRQEIEKLWSAVLGGNSGVDDQQDAHRNLEELQAENKNLRELISTLKSENNTLIEERESLRFALQIISKACSHSNDSTTSNEINTKSTMLFYNLQIKETTKHCSCHRKPLVKGKSGVTERNPRSLNSQSIHWTKKDNQVSDNS